MKTSKPIAGVSYNSPAFLKSKIEYWKSLGLIEFGMWIYHKAEEGEKKDHYHVYLKPAKLLQTMDLEQDSCEVDPNSDKPLKIVGLSPSKETDWVLYTLHDQAYLMEKGLERSYHYDISDFETTCTDTLANIIYHVADERKGKVEYRLIDAVNMGMSWYAIVKSGMIPMRHMAGALLMYKALTGQEKSVQ